MVNMVNLSLSVGEGPFGVIDVVLHFCYKVVLAIARKLFVPISDFLWSNRLVDSPFSRSLQLPCLPLEIST